MTLEEEFENETNQQAYDGAYIRYNPYYVEWLENKIETLLDNMT